MTLIALWSATHAYTGLVGDAELYAVQALTRIHHGLSADVFLSSGSQDKYTFFSTIYAWCIRRLGLSTAAIAFTFVCKSWFFAGAWALVRVATSARTACIALALLVTAQGTYGAYGVFHYAEDWLTARSLAEALTVTAVALHFHNCKVLGLALAVAALAIHPIMALPGLLLLLCPSIFASRQSDSRRVSACYLHWCSRFWAQSAEPSAGLLTILDSSWLEVVQERSAFLFLQFWTGPDWAISARPLILSRGRWFGARWFATTSTGCSSRPRRSFGSDGCLHRWFGRSDRPLPSSPGVEGHVDCLSRQRATYGTDRVNHVQRCPLRSHSRHAPHCGMVGDACTRSSVHGRYLVFLVDQVPGGVTNSRTSSCARNRIWSCRGHVDGGSFVACRGESGERPEPRAPRRSTD